MTNILIVFDSRGGKTEQLATLMARGVQVAGATSIVRRVPRVSAATEQSEDTISDGIPYVTKDELRNCDGLALGSPTRFGNMSAALKYFIDSTSDIWLSGQLSGKPATVFTSTGSLHGGQETTLLSMMLPLMHHGMLVCGLPYAGTELANTQSGGTPYGVTHWDGVNNDKPISDHESEFAKQMGTRLAELALKLKQ